MKWVTRERPKIDRIACPWLIARFIDKEPEFLYVPAAEVLATAAKTGAVPYDIPGVEMSHVGELCSFDAFVAKHNLTDPALQQLASIVRGADTSRLDLTPQSAVRWALRHIAGSVTDFLRRPRDAQARHRHVRHALRVVRDLPNRDTQVAARDVVMLRRRRAMPRWPCTGKRSPSLKVGVGRL